MAQVMKQFSVLLVLLGIVAIISVTEYRHFSITPKPAAQVTKVHLAMLQQQKVPTVVQSYGTVISDAAQDILAQADGRVVAINYLAGQWVEKGMVLFRLDTADLAAELANKKEALVLARKQLKMYQALYKKAVIAKIDFDKMTTVYAQAHDDYQKAVKNEQFMTVRAPISGTVMASPYAVGSVISNNAVLATIIPKKGYEISYYMGQKWRRQLALNQTVTINQQVPGLVVYIAPMANDVFAVEVRAQFDNRKLKLLPGMMVSVKHTVGQRQSVVIPRDHVGSDSKGFYIFTVVQDKLKQHYFAADSLLADGKMVVNTGLTVGEKYVTSDISTLSAGEKVVVSHAPD